MFRFHATAGNAHTNTNANVNSSANVNSIEEAYFAIVEAVVVVVCGMLTCVVSGTFSIVILIKSINHSRQIIRLAIDLQLPSADVPRCEDRVNVFDLFSRS